MPKYLLDFKLLGAVTLEAPTLVDAKRILTELLDCASCNAGALPNGDPLLFEASLDGEIDYDPDSQYPED